MSDFNSKTLGKCLCIITGASKGFGRCLAQQVPPLLEAGSALILWLHWSAAAGVKDRAGEPGGLSGAGGPVCCS
uniref:Uncharacterized protein n=1 Tax=Knipowitschia caucasica TaxID=637954 RepID=A0AAV2MQ60_KNICA